MNKAATNGHAGRAEANASVDTIESMLTANRAALDNTLSELEQRISMDGLVHGAMERLRTEEGAEFLRSLRDSVVHNPLPIVLTAIGLAWTAFSESNGRAGSSGLTLGSAQQKTADAAHRARGAVAEAREGAAQRLGAVKAQGHDWAGRGSEAMGNARERAGELGQGAAERTRRSVEQTRDFAREYPIIMAGAGLALGSALAALLPATQFENEKLGPARDRAMREARKAAATTAKGAKEGAEEEASSGGTGRDEQWQTEAGPSGHPGGDGLNSAGPHFRKL